ncbi:GGDEF domain-containing protein [Lachnoclostridium sp. Marseille-P6806]|uniref:GGDEF domain-containing protein n=1 Tax=Lachnoclostridium sp. Marseille-P6806 TaxID=2364793 RepID=UPI0013EF1130|nr:GGDEF domain-containing protein [Lachnoclostridium sp. Marseille-P6806]
MLLILCSALAMLFLLQCIQTLPDVSRPDYQSVDNVITVDVLRRGGVTEHYDGADFAPAGKEETVVVNLSLPEERRIADASLCFYWYNATCTVSHDKKIIYSYGNKRYERQIPLGNLLFTVPIPENAWGDTLQITLAQREGSSLSNVHSMRIMPTVGVRRYPLIRHGLEFFSFLTLGVNAAFLLLILLLLRRHLRVMPLFCLCLYTIASSVWMFGYLRLFYVFTSNTAFAANIEYITIFLVPISLSMLIKEQSVGSRVQAASSIFGGGFIVLFIFAVLNRAATGMHLLVFSPLIGLFMALYLIVCAVLLHLLPKAERNEENSLLRSALTIASVLSVLELARNALSQYALLPPFLSSLLSRSTFLPVAVLSLLYSFGLIEFMRQRREQQSVRNRKRLDLVAYHDALTCIPNRQFALKEFHLLEKSRIPEFCVFFFDADGLKRANDLYGHEAGDILLRETASCIKSAFERPDSFYARWGGDEFIACIRGDAEPDAVMHSFYTAIEKTNAKNLLPFPISVSCGFCQSTLSAPFRPTEAIEEADRRMYASKQQRKAAARERALTQEAPQAQESGACSSSSQDKDP